jgi:hypothetical protein
LQNKPRGGTPSKCQLLAVIDDGTPDAMSGRLLMIASLHSLAVFVCLEDAQ